MSKKIIYSIGVLLGLSLFAVPYLSSALSTFITVQGGTGTTTPSGILYGDNGATTHLNTVTIDSGLSFIGGTLGLNLANANTWTGLQQFNGNASTTALTISDPADNLGKIFSGTSGLVVYENGSGEVFRTDDTGAYSVPGFQTTGGNFLAEPTGSAAFPAFGFFTDGIGMFRTGGSLGFSAGSLERLTLTGATGNQTTSVGIASTSPYATLSIHANNGSTNTTLFAVASSTASATTTLFSISNTGTVKIGSLTGLIKGTSGTLSAASNGTDYTLITAKTCTAGDFVSAATAAGIFTCATPTFPFSYPFPSNATSTTLTFSGGLLSTASSTFTGELVGRDTTNSFTGRISPTHSFALTTGTTTTWTASTTGTAYSPFIIMPFTGTLKQVYCLTDASFLGVNVQVNGSNATPLYFVASTTAGNVSFTAGNTFSKGQKVLMNVGTTTSATAQSISCTFDATETP